MPLSPEYVIAKIEQRTRSLAEADINTLDVVLGLIETIRLLATEAQPAVKEASEQQCKASLDCLVNLWEDF